MSVCVCGGKYACDREQNSETCDLIASGFFAHLVFDSRLRWRPPVSAVPHLRWRVPLIGLRLQDLSLLPWRRSPDLHADLRPPRPQVGRTLCWTAGRNKGRRPEGGVRPNMGWSSGLFFFHKKLVQACVPPLACAAAVPRLLKLVHVLPFPSLVSPR